MTKQGRSVVKLVPLGHGSLPRPPSGCTRVVDSGDEHDLAAEREAAAGGWEPR